ncbi:hypothetical protein GCM10010530_52370 [Kribbella aluminosa]
MPRSVKAARASDWVGSSGSGRYVENRTSAKRGGGTHSDSKRSGLTSGHCSLNRTTMRTTLSVVDSRTPSGPVWITGQDLGSRA